MNTESLTEQPRHGWARSRVSCIELGAATPSQRQLPLQAQGTAELGRTATLPLQRHMWLHGQQTSLLGMPSCPGAHWASGGCVGDRAELRQGLDPSFAATSSLNSGIYSPEPKGDESTEVGWELPAWWLSQKGGAAWARPVAPLSAEGLRAALARLAELAQVPAHWSWRQPLPQPVQGRNLARMATAQARELKGADMTAHVCCSLAVVTLSRCKLLHFKNNFLVFTAMPVKFWQFS